MRTKTSRASYCPSILPACALALAAILFASPRAMAQPPAGSPGNSGAPSPPAPAPGPGAPAAEGGFGESIDVKVVNIDVVVRGKDGKQLNDLRREDFTLYVDGKKTEITNFARTGAGPAPSAPTTEAPAGTATPTPTPATEVAAPPLRLVIFLDNFNMRPFDRNRRIKELRSFLESTIKPGDRVLLVTHDPGLRVRSRFEDDPATLGPILDKLGKESSAGPDKQLARKQTFEDLQEIIRAQGCIIGYDTARGIARAYAQQVLAETRLTYANLHHLLQSLGGLEGRKALLYIGDGLPTTAGIDALGRLEELCPAQATGVTGTSAEQLNATAPLHQVITDANANMVTFFTLEASGLSTYSNDDYAGASFELLQRISMDRQDSLTSLARETGGRSALNGNDFRHDLQQITGELRSSYSLGFTPPPSAPGATHALRVEIDRPGVRASYRNGYRDRSLREQLEGELEAALLYAQTTNPLAASLKVGTATLGEHGRVTVPIQIRVPFHLLTLVPQGDANRGSVSFLVSDLDAHGGIAPAQRAQLPLRIPEADLKRVLSSQMGYDLKIVVEPGHQRIGLVVRDDVSHTTSTITQELDIDKQGIVKLQ